MTCPVTVIVGSAVKAARKTLPGCWLRLLLLEPSLLQPGKDLLAITVVIHTLEVVVPLRISFSHAPLRLPSEHPQPLLSREMGQIRPREPPSPLRYRVLLSVPLPPAQVLCQLQLAVEFGVFLPQSCPPVALVGRIVRSSDGSSPCSSVNTLPIGQLRCHEDSLSSPRPKSRVPAKRTPSQSTVEPRGVWVG